MIKFLLVFLLTSLVYASPGYAQQEITEVYCSKEVPRAIPDGGSVTSALTVPDRGIIDDVVFKMYLSHTFRGTYVQC